MTTSKRLAKNTMYMYIRMIILMIISFYTSRVVLKQLGVDDFGIYNLVGSVVSMFSSLRTIFAASTQRFLSYEIGRDNVTALNSIFNCSLIVNFFISIIFLIIVEIVGVWFLNTRINVAPERLLAAKYVFQFSVFSAVIGIITTTFDAEIIAHERMNFYACLSIIEGVLKLLIVFALSLVHYDKLIVYGLLLLIISLIVLLVDFLFCRIKFAECRVNIRGDRSYLRDMTKFAGWNFLGANAYVLSQSGLNMILNIFGGPTVNAARGIAYQVNGALNQFINNIVVVINPYCVKTYASGNSSKTFATIHLSSKILYLIQFLIMTPLMFLSEKILELWLGIVPDYSIIFLQLILFYSLLRTLHSGIDILFKAKGEIKHYQICEGILLIIPLIVSYILLKNGFSYTSVFIAMIVFDFINLLSILFLSSKITGLSIKRYLKEVLFPCTTLAILLICVWLLTKGDSTLNLLIYSLIIDIVAFTFMILIGLSKEEKLIVFNILKLKVSVQK